MLGRENSESYNNSLTSKQLKEKYNLSAADYSRRETEPFWMGPVHRVIDRELEELSPDICIDIGCGSGGLISQLALRFPHIRFIGLDLSDALIEIALGRSRDFRNTEFHCGDFVEWSKAGKMDSLGIS